MEGGGKTVHHLAAKPLQKSAVVSMHRNSKGIRRQFSLPAQFVDSIPPAGGRALEGVEGIVLQKLHEHLGGGADPKGAQAPMKLRTQLSPRMRTHGLQ